ncbi:exosortase-associated protein EpsI, B-type [Piscinibacter sp. XHJ-5]|uniref:exosortase-associated protein EpsI, B-type n=1 Tax=Piscinibacter sp. XHJ-5 TaxID=3037797 RepID=UPI0024536BCB|nr:exosortase-associated protein EpsI, B-type [Piscinibacter sp. XHJ-5]
MSSVRISIVLAGLMALAAVGGIAARPTAKPPGSAPRYILEDTVPKQFGDWRLLPQSSAQVVNPQTKELLDKLYSQILSRTYVNGQGYRVMLALAYGDEQRGDLQAHKPEVCYPAQGFKLLSNDPAELATPFGGIAARRLNTVLGPRQEPVTYWFTMGDTAVKSKFEQRLVEIRLGLTGQVPDGLLFRVSSIDESTQRAFQMQDAFITDLLKAVPARDRMRLSGLGAAASPG